MILWYFPSSPGPKLKQNLPYSVMIEPLPITPRAVDLLDISWNSSFFANWQSIRWAFAPGSKKGRQLLSPTLRFWIRYMELSIQYWHWTRSPVWESIDGVGWKIFRPWLDSRGLGKFSPSIPFFTISCSWELGLSWEGLSPEVCLLDVCGEGSPEDKLRKSFLEVLRHRISLVNPLPGLSDYRS